MNWLFMIPVPDSDSPVLALFVWLVGIVNVGESTFMIRFTVLRVRWDRLQALFVWDIPSLSAQEWTVSESHQHTNHGFTLDLSS